MCPPNAEDMGRLERAEALYERAIASDDHHVTALFNYGLMLEEAVKDHRRCAAETSEVDAGRAPACLFSYRAALSFLLPRCLVFSITALPCLSLTALPSAALARCDWYAVSDLGVLGRAAAMYRRVLVLEPTHFFTLANYGGLLDSVLQVRCTATRADRFGANSRRDERGQG